MKFLAIDTSGRRLGVAAKNGEKLALRQGADAMQHSAALFGEIEAALAEAGLEAKDCDFFAVVVGPGSFTGIRIGISAVKGLCLALGKPALAVTSFETLAYIGESGKTLALVDAGHGFRYACGYDGPNVAVPAAYRSGEEVRALIEAGYRPVGVGLPEAESADVCLGLARAAEKKAGEAGSASSLAALYLRRSSAEEHR